MNTTIINTSKLSKALSSVVFIIVSITFQQIKAMEPQQDNISFENKNKHAQHWIAFNYIKNHTEEQILAHFNGPLRPETNDWGYRHALRFFYGLRFEKNIDAIDYVEILKNYKIDIDTAIQRLQAIYQLFINEVGYTEIISRTQIPEKIRPILRAQMIVVNHLAIFTNNDPNKIVPAKDLQFQVKALITLLSPNSKNGFSQH